MSTDRYSLSNVVRQLKGAQGSLRRASLRYGRHADSQLLATLAMAHLAKALRALEQARRLVKRRRADSRREAA